MINQILTMHNHFDISTGDIKWSAEEKVFRIDCLQEELYEYQASTTLEDELDALVDLVVFALGTAERQGLMPVFAVAFERVMNANMKKEIGPNSKRGSFAIDLVKPEGWEAPDHSDLVNNQLEMF